MDRSESLRNNHQTLWLFTKYMEHGDQNRIYAITLLDFIARSFNLLIGASLHYSYGGPGIGRTSHINDLFWCNHRNVLNLLPHHKILRSENILGGYSTFQRTFILANDMDFCR